MGTHMLTERKLRELKAKPKIYRVADRGGLCIEMRPTGSKFWRYRYRFAGSATMMSLGKYPEMSLAEARHAHAAAAKILRSNKNPATERRADNLRRQVANSNTFEGV